MPQAPNWTNSIRPQNDLLASNFEGAHILLLELAPEPETRLIVNASRKLVR